MKKEVEKTGTIVTMYDKIWTEYPDVVTVDEMCKMLRVCKSRAYELIRNGEIRSLRTGTRYRIPKVSVIRFMGMEV